MKHGDRPARRWRSVALAASACLYLAAWSSVALAQSALDAMAGRWTAAEGQEIPVRIIVIQRDRSGLVVEKALSSGGSVHLEYEPSDEGDFLVEENSSTNPLEDTPAQWIRIGENSLHMHRLEATDAGGLMVTTEELQVSGSDPGTMDYRRLVFRDGIPIETLTGSLTRGE